MTQAVDPPVPRRQLRFAGGSRRHVNGEQTGTWHGLGARRHPRTARRTVVWQPVSRTRVGSDPGRVPMLPAVTEDGRLFGTPAGQLRSDMASSTVTREAGSLTRS